MSKVNLIEQKIKELEGGAFQKLFNAYIFKKYKFENIHTLGSQDGTNKPVKGIPDTYLTNNDGTYTLIMYGSVQNNPYKKLRGDILSCLNKKKLDIEKDKIKKIICGYCSSKLTIDQSEKLKNLIKGTELILIDLSTISHDLCYNYQDLAFDFLGIQIDTRQIYSPEEFMKVYDKNPVASPLSIKKFMFREKELREIVQSILNTKATLVLGASGIGKTKLVLETLKIDNFKEYTILCVKNNGEILSSDINIHISNLGKYILFLDDANETTSFEYILHFINNAPKNIEIKLVMTVRDYAKEKLLITLCKQIQTNIIKIEKFNSDEIKEILKNNLGIVNRFYLERITDISKGNIRIAIMAGKIALEGNLNSIRNVIDVFKNYYGEILSKQEISQVESYTLFIIALFKAIHIYENRFLPKLLNLFNINEKDFIQSCINLHQRELIDLYDNKLAKISDQSLGDYILYYILIEKKTISIIDLLKLIFPDAKDAIINIINTILKLFYSNETYNYIEKQVVEAWHNAKEEEKEQYLKSFYWFNQDETLLFIKKEIDKIPCEQFDLSNIDIEKRFRSHYFETYLAEILSGFKYSDNYLNAIELLLELTSKNLECALDACYVFCNRFSYDKNSLSYNFEKEYLLLKTLSKHCNSSGNSNFAIMLLEVLKSLLVGEVTKAEPSEDPRSILFTTIHIILSDENKNLRNRIWKILSKLYKNKKYKQKIEKFLCNYDTRIHDNKKKNRICTI